MKLADLRKITIKQQVRIRFRLTGGLECVVNEHGIAQVPSLKGVPGFNLEDELTRAAEFLLESAGRDRSKAKAQTLTREQLAALVASGSTHESLDEHAE